MAVNKNLVRTVVTIVGTAGPVVTKYLKDHPEIGAAVGEAVTKLVKRRPGGTAGLIETVGVLREQVDYLRESADDEEESRRAAHWAKQLDNLEHAAIMLRDRATTSEKKVLRMRLERLRGEILAAFIAEQAEDSAARQIDS